MSRISRSILLGAAFGLLLAARPVRAQQEAGTQPPAAAQQPPAGAPAAAAPAQPRDIQLVFEREVFHYSTSGRRDPFRSLADAGGLGPLFDDLTLRMIIHSDRPGQSVALVIDGSKKVYRLRKGDVVGNATVLEITAQRVVFSVEDFGNRRQETLDLKNQKEGA
jgi:hypothetical protein